MMSKIVINTFGLYKNKNLFQEPLLLESNTFVSCQENHRFQPQEPPLFERKSMELAGFQLLSVLEDMVLCHADLANHRFWFSISHKTVTVNFLYHAS